MAEAEQKTNNNEIESNKKETLGEIKPLKIDTDTQHANSNPESVKDSINENFDSEKSLVNATRQLLREYGIRKSAAAVRDAVEMPHELFKPQSAVSALSSLGFKSSFGNIKLRKEKLGFK